MDISDILAIDGIVVRKIPATSTSTFAYKAGDENRLGVDDSIFEHNGHKFVRKVTANSLVGYAVTIKLDQFSTVRFHKKYDGFGDTIEAAYQDYLSKRS